MDDFKKTLNDCLQEFALDQIEVGPIRSPLTIGFYENWLQENHYGNMTYLKDHYDIKKNPQLLDQRLQSVISVAQSYFPTVQPHSVSHPARVALYAQNLDYHFWLKEKLKQIILKLQIQFPDEIFLPYVDSGPILERNWAYENRLGWFGKNTCLIHPEKGSLFFIAEIMTSLAVTDNELEPLPDFCGKCQKCIDICPTQALTSARQMKADQCISYLTIESKEVPALELRSKIGDWFFGCDLCQTVCPWNEKVFRKNQLPASPLLSKSPHLELQADEKEKLISYFRWLLQASHKQIQKSTLGSPLARAGAKGLKRNALIVIANQQLVELKADVEKLELESLQELKQWALEQLYS